MKRVIAYTRISKADAKRDASLGIGAQRKAILRAAEHHEWDIVAWYTDDGVTGRHMRRPGITAALKDLKAHHADGLVATKLDRLSRSTQDFARLLDLARRQKWDVAVLDFALDTSTATGRFIAGILMQVAQFEREIIGERTSAALAVRKEEGAQLGKPSAIPADVQARIVAAHRAGATFSGIARDLDAEAVPTPGSSPRWHHSVVAGVVHRQGASLSPLPRTNHVDVKQDPRDHEGNDHGLKRPRVRKGKSEQQADGDEAVDGPEVLGSAPEVAAQHAPERTPMREAVPA